MIVDLVQRLTNEATIRYPHENDQFHGIEGLDRVQYFSDDYQKVIPKAKYLFSIADLVQTPDGLRILDDRRYELLF